MTVKKYGIPCRNVVLYIKLLFVPTGSGGREITMDIEKTVKNLEMRGFAVKRFATGAGAAEYLANELRGKTVGIGGSRTVEEIGLYDMLDEKNVYWHWKNKAPDTRRNAMTAQCYVSGANAISEDGEIFNIDGTGNRVAGTLYGHEKVYIVSSVSKICRDFDSALFRARNTAAVRNCARFGLKTPCQTDGKCHDCRSPQRICHALVVLWGPMGGMDTELVLIDEQFGM